MNRLLLLTLLLAPMVSLAQIYKSTDANGNVSYSDTPPKAGPVEQIELREPNIEAPPPEQARPQPQPSTTKIEASQYSLSIVAPANETTFPMGPGDFTVNASVDPALRVGNQLQLYVDGTAWGEPQSGTSWSLTNVYRGAHNLTVAVTNADGKQLSISKPIRVYVLRPSIQIKRN